MCLPGTYQSPETDSQQCIKPGMMVHSRSPGHQEVGVGGSGVQRPSLLHSFSSYLCHKGRKQKSMEKAATSVGGTVKNRLRL